MADTPANPFALPTAGLKLPGAFAGFQPAPAGAPIAPQGLGDIVPPEMIQRQDRRADLLWGFSKTGKGINSWMAAYWIAKVKKKKFLYLTAEPGSMPVSISMALKAGLGDMFSLVGQKHLLSILSAIFEGARWPVYRKLNDGSMMRDFKTVEAVIDPSEYGLIITDSLTSIGDELIRWLADPDNKATLPMTPGKE